MLCFTSCHFASLFRIFGMNRFAVLASRLVLNQVAKVSHFLSFLKYVIMENLHRIFLCAHSTTVYNSISVSAQNYITHIHTYIALPTERPHSVSHIAFLRETYTTNELRVGSGYLHKHSLLCL